MATADLIIWQKKKKSVAANSTVVVDELPMSKFDTLEYIISIIGALPTDHKYLKLSVFKDDTTVNDTVFGRYGSSLNVGINAIVTGSLAQIQVVNGESFDVDVVLTRTIL